MTYKNLVGKDIKSGISIICAVMNRNNFLLQTIPTWLRLKVDEIIIVDWGSTENVTELVKSFSDPRLVLVSVNFKSKWILSIAYNIALRFTSRENVIKVDSDTILNHDFLTENLIHEYVFRSGDWRKARNENERHTNGIVYVKRNALFDIHGYNEYIQTYGWDDCDLYDRLIKNRLKRVPIELDSVNHIPHGDDLRKVNQNIDRLDVEIEKNRLLCEELPWTGPMMPINGYIKHHNHHYTIGHPLTIPTPFKEIVDKCYSQAWRNKNQKRSTFYIEVQNGLCNRLRSFASAFNIARASKRNLCLVWIPNHHCEARFTDLFDLENVTKFIEQFDIKFKVVHIKIDINIKKCIPGRGCHSYCHCGSNCCYEQCKCGCKCRCGCECKPNCECGCRQQSNNESNRLINDKNCYDYNDSTQKNKYIDDTIEGDIYVISACCLNNKYTSWEKEAQFLRKLAPTYHISEKIQNFKDNLLQRGINIKDCVGIHIRMHQWGKSYEDISDYSPSEKEKVIRWRNASHWKTFLEEITRLMTIDQNTKFFLCCDNEEAYNELVKHVSNNLIYHPKNVFDRSKQQLIGAMVDLWLLGQTRKLLGSNWSTFTEVAHKLNGRELRMAGVHF